jgi:hypothetical protein
MPEIVQFSWPDEIRRIAAEALGDHQEYERYNLRLAADAMDRLAVERDAAINQLSRVSTRVGLVEGTLAAVADRLDYLQSLWGKEGITDRMAQRVREVLAETGEPEEPDA